MGTSVLERQVEAYKKKIEKLHSRDARQRKLLEEDIRKYLRWS